MPENCQVNSAILRALLLASLYGYPLVVVEVETLTKSKTVKGLYMAGIQALKAFMDMEAEKEDTEQLNEFPGSPLMRLLYVSKGDKFYPLVSTTFR